MTDVKGNSCQSGICQKRPLSHVRLYWMFFDETTKLRLVEGEYRMSSLIGRSLMKSTKLRLVECENEIN